MNETEIFIDSINTVNHVEEKCYQDNDNCFKKCFIVNKHKLNVLNRACAILGTIIMFSTFLIIMAILIVGITLTVVLNSNFFSMVLIDCAIGVPLLVLIIAITYALIEKMDKYVIKYNRENPN